MWKRRKRKKLPRAEARLRLATLISLAVLIASLAAVYCINALRLTGTLTPTMELIDGHASVRFVDVGQGDCTLITHRGHAVLIDAGPAWFEDVTAEYVRTYAPKIDAFFVTHPHEDHMGAAPAVLRACRVGSMYMSNAVSHESFYEETLTAAKKRKTKTEILREGGTYCFGDIRVEVYDTFDYPYEELNDASLVMRITVDSLSILIAGDAERGLESYVCASGFDIAADIYHAGHHGSSSSSTAAFLDRIRPSVAVISCGRNNVYGHPARQVLDRFEERGITVRRTDLEGTVVIRGGP